MDERILQHVQTQVVAIQKAAGYSVDMRHVTRKLGDMPELPAAIVYSPTDDPAPEGNMGFQDLHLTVVVEAWKQEEMSGLLDTEMRRMRADIMRAVLADPTCGGLAVDTVYDGSVLHVTDRSDDEAGITMRFRVHFRHLMADPFSG